MDPYRTPSIHILILFLLVFSFLGHLLTPCQIRNDGMILKEACGGKWPRSICSDRLKDTTNEHSPDSLSPLHFGLFFRCITARLDTLFSIIVYWCITHIISDDCNWGSFVVKGFCTGVKTCTVYEEPQHDSTSTSIRTVRLFSQCDHVVEV